MPTIPSGQQFKTIDRVRVEVGDLTQPGRNRVPNPDGKLGGWGWSSAEAGTSIDGRQAINDPVAIFFRGITAAAPDGCIFVMDRVALDGTVATEADARASIRLGAAIPAGTIVNFSIEWLDASMVRIGALAPLTLTDASAVTTHATAVSTRPAGAVYVRLRCGVSNTIDANRWVRADQIMLAMGASGSLAAMPAYNDGPTWTNLVGTSHEIKIGPRAGLAPAFATIGLKGVTFDPSATNLLRPGHPIRITAERHPDYPTLLSVDTWDALFTGRILTPVTTYGPTGKGSVFITAVDPIPQLGNIGRSTAVGTVNDLRYLMEGSRVPWRLDGNVNLPAGTPTVLADVPNASLLDVVSMVRDTLGGEAHMDRYGVLEVNGSRNVSVRATLTQDRYKWDADIAYDPAAIINAVTIRVLRKVGGVTQEFTLGPYRDERAIQLAGGQVYASTFTVVGLSDTQAATLAANILAKSSTPQRRIRRITVPITTWPDDFHGSPYSVFGENRRAFIEQEMVVTVSNSTLGITQDSRVTSVTHTITSHPPKWLMQLELAPINNTPLPRQVPRI